MELPFAVSAAISPVIERLFAANDEARSALEPHAGGLVRVDLQAPDVTFCVLVLEHTLEVLSVSDEEADALVHTDWAGLVALSRGTDAMLSGKVRIRGDLRLVEGVHRAVSLLAVDWEDQVAPYIGDTLAHKLGNVFTRGRQDASRNHERDIADVENYLKHETGILVSPVEWRELTDDTDVLRQDLDRLSARIDKMDSAS